MNRIEGFLNRFRNPTLAQEVEPSAEPNPLKDVLNLIGSDDPNLYMKLGHALLDLSKALLPTLGKDIEKFRRAWEQSPHEHSREMLDLPAFFPFRQPPRIDPYMVTSFVEQLEPLAKLRKPLVSPGVWSHSPANFQLPFDEGGKTFLQNSVILNHPLQINFSIDGRGVKRANLDWVDKRHPRPSYPTIKAKFAQLQQGL